MSLDEMYRLRDRLDAQIQRAEQARGRTAAIRYRGTSQRVIAAVAAVYQLAPADLTGRSRKHLTTEARQVAAWIIRSEGISYPAIARALCRDHSTIMHAVRRVDGDPELARLAKQIKGRNAA